MQQPRTLVFGPGCATRCADEGAALVIESLRSIQNRSVMKRPQDDREATFAPLLKPEDSVVDWNTSAAQIHYRVRGLSPRPGAFAQFLGKRVRLVQTEPVEDGLSAGVPGRVAVAGTEGLLVETASGLLRVERLQPENRSAVSGVDFVNGYRVKVGDRFG